MRNKKRNCGRQRLRPRHLLSVRSIFLLSFVVLIARVQMIIYTVVDDASRVNNHIVDFVVGGVKNNMTNKNTFNNNSKQFGGDHNNNKNNNHKASSTLVMTSKIQKDNDNNENSSQIIINRSNTSILLLLGEEDEEESQYEKQQRYKTITTTTRSEPLFIEDKEEEEDFLCNQTTNYFFTIPWAEVKKDGPKLYELVTADAVVKSEFDGREYVDSNLYKAIRQQMEYSLCSSAEEVGEEVTTSVEGVIDNDGNNETQPKKQILCLQSIEVMKCKNCITNNNNNDDDDIINKNSSDDNEVVEYYSAVSSSGSVVVEAKMSLISNENNELIYYESISGFDHKRIDILIPACRIDEKLIEFIKRLGVTIQQYRRDVGNNVTTVDIRVFVTRYPDEDTSDDLRQRFTKYLSLSLLSSNDTNPTTRSSSISSHNDTATNYESTSYYSSSIVTFVKVLENNFSRAHALNVLQKNACDWDDCVVTGMDVDMDIGPSYIRNALAYVYPNKSAYFPIVWSQYNPETVRTVAKYMGVDNLPKFYTEVGIWRDFGFGMYAISGSDTNRFRFNETFEGWGGEDKDFYSRIRSELNVVRMREHGLVHRWHPKNCHSTSFVGESYRDKCANSVQLMMGSVFGYHLRTIEKDNPEEFAAIISNKRAGNVWPITSSKSPEILIAVVTSRGNFGERVGEIMDTWGSPKTLPSNIMLRFFVGSSRYDVSLVEDAVELASEAETTYVSWINIIPEIVEDDDEEESSSVQKNFAMLHVAASIRPRFIFKVEDDEYVNIDGLLNFTRDKDPTVPQLWGRCGFGSRENHAGLLAEANLTKEGYSRDGAGYIMSWAALNSTISHLDQCIQDVAKSPYRENPWHSDFVIGICLQKYTNVSCWDGDGNNNRTA